ncbi:uncharacterized protein FOMMEDRAFT_31071 [Fomitiporia mediterranea MF3/22]|uniref:uncharacterized protein n=1 Tax=Fomitiporia mediterranea (strain MF3/22) TaxID=694068 RepID=UPI00044076BB|nr:uncharacterized protein FOMMEDRAFT_31071 [Fomitiporia mediterranea MF3/22]EJC99810.1 hypothetical protein FOMMEDRAFT_31071 [Fomitiporia mediterranea MF3/22]
MSYIGQNKEDVAWEETKNIARLFAEDTGAPDSSLSSSVGILPSCGYTQLDTHLHAIVFRVPPEAGPPRTLRNLLVERNVKHSLHDRVQFAIKLATSVLVVHSLGLVHKSIRPDSILVIENAAGSVTNLYPHKLGIPYLLAFDSSRSSRGPTMRERYAFPNGAIWGTLYKHPRHLGFRQYDYEMRDDIFSLGVCLLEIALWDSLFVWNSNEGGFVERKEAVDLSEDRCREEIAKQGRPKNSNKTLFRKYLLKEAAKEKIPPILGDLFRDVVVACLTFGDPFEVTKDNAFQSLIEAESDLPPDEQSIHFVRTILGKLRSIKLA